jgi:hypothetical protein
MTLPTLLVEIAFTTTPDDPSPVYVDVTQWTRALSGVSITRGRQDEHGEVQPSKCNLTLINSDGRFTPGNVNSPYYPNVKKGRKIRVSVTHNAVTYRRFTGYVDEWPVTWADASATVADAPISASSRLARLGRGTELRSIVEEEYLLDEPRAYYTFGEPEGATQAGNVSTTPQPALSFAGSGTNPTFGTATGPGTDGLTAAAFAGGKYLSTLFDQPIVTSSHTTFVMECFFLTSTTSTAHDLMWLDLRNGSGEASGLYIEHPSGKLRARGDGPGGVPTNYFLASSAAVWDGATHHALIRETISGGNLTATLYLDGVQVDTSTTAYAGFGARDRLRVGGGVFNTITGTLAHAAVTPGTTQLATDRIEAHSDSGLNGFSGEGSGTRIIRLAGYAGVAVGSTDTETGLSTSITNQVTNGQTALALMSEVVETEGGLLFDSGGGVLTFHARSHRYNAASTLTLSGDGGELQASLEAKLDDQGLVNDMTASREGGVSARAVDTASIDDYGLYRESIELLTTSDNEVADAANWKVNTASTPQVRVPVAEADLGNASSSQKTALLAREIGDRITLANLPSQAPAASMDFFIEGYTETITAELYRISFNLSPASLSGVWQLDSSVYSLLGTTTRLGY